MIILKRLFFLFLTSLFIMGAVGCEMSGRMNGKDRVNRMVSYINDKYPDDSFELVTMSGGYLGSDDKKILVKSEKYPDKEIRVICYENEGKEYFSDTYLNVKFEKETYEYIKNSLSDSFDTSVYVDYTPDDTASVKNGSSTTSFSDFISDESTYIYFNAIVVTDDFDENDMLEKVKKAFNNGVVLGNIYFVNSSYTSQLNEADPFVLIEEQKYDKLLFIIKDSVEEYKRIEWEK